MKVEFIDGYAVGFAMAVPECFRDSLAKERFNAGDILYDDKRAYLADWAKALGYISYAVQVVGMAGDNVTFAPLIREGSRLVRGKDRSVTASDFIGWLKDGFEY